MWCNRAQNLEFAREEFFHVTVLRVERQGSCNCNERCTPVGCLFSTRKSRPEVPERGDLGEENCPGKGGADRAKKKKGKKDAQKKVGKSWFLGIANGGVPGRGFSNSWMCCVFFAWKSVIAREILLKIDTSLAIATSGLKTNLLFEKPPFPKTPHSRYCKRGSGGQRKIEKIRATFWDSKLL